jgi:hypothetical protein
MPSSSNFDGGKLPSQEKLEICEPLDKGRLASTQETIKDPLTGLTTKFP